MITDVIFVASESKTSSSNNYHQRNQKTKQNNNKVPGQNILIAVVEIKVVALIKMEAKLLSTLCDKLF